MSIIKQYSRLSHHTVSTTGSAFTIPSGSIEDFTGGTWEITDLVKSEIGVNEMTGLVSIRIGDDSALTKPTIRDPMTAPGIDPIVPRTITANEGRSRANAVSGL